MAIEAVRHGASVSLLARSEVISFIFLSTVMLMNAYARKMLMFSHFCL